MPFIHIIFINLQIVIDARLRDASNPVEKEWEKSVISAKSARG